MDNRWSFALDKICCYCTHYTFKSGNPDPPGQAYCLHFRAWFAGLQDLGTTPIGERTCDHWLQKGEKV